MSKTRWRRFRQLCRYYRDCLRFEELDQLRVLEDHRGDSWSSVPETVVQALDEESAASVELPLDDQLTGMLATMLRHQDWCTWLGHPLVRMSRGRRAWIAPVLAMPVRVQRCEQGIRIVRDGPILPNRAALEQLCDDSQARQSCLEQLGLVPVEVAVGAGSPLEPSWKTMTAMLAQLELVTGPGLHEALLSVTRRGQYHRRLAEELGVIAEVVGDAELDASALRLVFAEDPPAPPDPRPVATLSVQHSLDPGQRQAIAAALSDPLTVVTGPPGTGKSTMVRQVLVNLALAGGSALLASRNHRALDAVEPALNALSPRDTLVVRTSHHGQERSWQQALMDLLDRSDGELTQVAAADDAWRAARDRVAALEADLAVRNALEDRCRERIAQWSAALAAVPPQLRSVVAAGAWEGPGQAPLMAARSILDSLGQGGWRRLLPPGDARRAATVSAQIATWAQQVGLSMPLQAITEDPAAWMDLLEVLERAAAAQAAWEACRDAQRRLDAVDVDRDACLQDLAEAQRCCWQRAVALLVDRAAAGPADPAAREDLANLRAGLSSFGLGRMAAVYRDRFDHLLVGRPLWACSNLSAPATLPRRAGLFDLLVLDEASQCDIPGIIPLLLRCRRILAVGDPQQLGHISGLSAGLDERLLAAHGLTDLEVQRFGYRCTSAWRLLRETPGCPTPILLADHYRCHPHIASLFNRAFYRQRLRICTEALAPDEGERWTVGVHWHEVDSPLLPVPHGACAPDEADRIVALLRDLEQAGYSGSLGVATPFRQQVALIRQRIEAAISPAFCQRCRLLVATAHGFQGDERDIIFFSLCGGDALRPGAARFLAATPHLFNVAVSRARQALHLVGNRTWAARSGLDFIRALARGDTAEMDPASAAVCDSEPERQLRAALAEAGIDALPQFAVCGRRIDLAVIAEGRRIAIEVDGTAHHATATGQRSDDDCWRDLILSEAGWRVLRFWAHEIRERCPDCVAKVLATMNEP